MWLGIHNAVAYIKLHIFTRLSQGGIPPKVVTVNRKGRNVMIIAFLHQTIEPITLRTVYFLCLSAKA